MSGRPPRSRGPGYAAVAAAAVLWAAGGAVASYVIDQGASLVELTEARAWISAVVLIAAVWIRRPDERDGGRVSPFLVVVFGLSIAAANFTYYASLSRLPVAVAITIQYTAPVLVVVWTVVAEAYRPSGRVAVALVLAVAGVALLAELPVIARQGHLRLSGVGLLLAGASAFAFSTYILTGERVGRELGAQRAVARGFVVASVLWIVVQASRGRPDTLLQARFLPWVVFLAVATTIAPFLLFVWGMGRVRASSAGVVSTLEPLAAAVIAFVWLGQKLSGWQIAGAVMVLAGVGVVQSERPVADEAPAVRAGIGE